jgi:hypothetical protein
MRNAASSGNMAIMTGVDENPYQSPRHAEPPPASRVARNRFSILVIKCILGLFLAGCFIPFYTSMLVNPLVALFLPKSDAVLIVVCAMSYFLGGYTGFWLVRRLKLTDDK